MVIMSPTSELSLHPDRLLPSEPGVRSTARELYDSVKDLPIISPHGHVPPQWLWVPIGCATTVAAWVLHLRGLGAPIKDPGAGPAQKAASSGELREAVPAVLEVLEPGLGGDGDFVDAVIRQAGAIQSQ
jgi:hypothetical protein